MIWIAAKIGGSPVCRSYHPKEVIMVLSSSSSLAAVQLPEHMVEAVLVKLPVRTLLRLKLLSKSFKALIENPRFVTAHLHYSSSYFNRCERRSIVLLTTNHNTDGTRVDKMVTVSRQRDEDPDHGDQVHHKEEQLPTFAWQEDEGAIVHYIDLLGSQNGLICLRLHYDDHHGKKKKVVVLWNPATKQSRTLPSLPSSSTHRSSRINCGVVDLGFVYNHETDDYMVSQIVSHNEPELSYQVDIFSMRRWGWRTHTCRRLELAGNTDILISGCIMSSLGPCHAVALRGSIYHVVSSVVVDSDEGTRCNFVLAMDFVTTDTSRSTNNFALRRIELPPEGPDCWVSSLMVYGEGEDRSLGLFSNVDGEEDGYLSCFKCNVWVLNDKCDDYVWSKLFTISIMHPASIDQPVASWGDGRIIVRKTMERKEEENHDRTRRRVVGNTLFIYDHHNSIAKGGELMRDNGLVGINGFISVNVCDYVESLVSLYPS